MKSKKRIRRAGSNSVMIHWVTDDGWIHTLGLHEMGYPELEVRNVPGYLGEAASALLRDVYGYMLDAKVRIKPNETMSTSPRTRFELVAAKPVLGEEDHHEGVERLQIVDPMPAREDCGDQPCCEEHKESRAARISSSWPHAASSILEEKHSG